MKNRLIILTVSCLSLLLGCVNGDRCGYPTACWQGYFKETPCGTYVASPCERICDQCTFNDAACQACLSCETNDGCGFGNISTGNMATSSNRAWWNCVKHNGCGSRDVKSFGNVCPRNTCAAPTCQTYTCPTNTCPH